VLAGLMTTGKVVVLKDCSLFACVKHGSLCDCASFECNGLKISTFQSSCVSPMVVHGSVAELAS
jgi:hypothetical protein